MKNDGVVISSYEFLSSIDATLECQRYSFIHLDPPVSKFDAIQEEDCA